MLSDWPSNQPAPHEYDILLSDVPEEAVPTTLSDALGCAYLSSASQAVLKNPTGILYGNARRCFLTLPVSCPDRNVPDAVNVHFLFDTGSLFTFLEPKVLKALNLPSYDLASVPVVVNGVKVRVNNSNEDRYVAGKFVPSHFAGVNVLGMQYLEAAEAEFKVNGTFGRSYCALSRP